MGELKFAAAVLAWGLLPGFILLWAARVPWSLIERASAAPGLSIVLVAFAAYLTEILGLPVSPLPVTLVMAAGAVVIRLLGVGSRARAYDAPVEWPFGVPRPSWVLWLVFLTPLVVIWQLESVWTLALLPPTLHDGLDHANWFRLILETRSVHPHEVAAPPLGPSGEPVYYPWGMHVWAALLVGASGIDPAAGFMRSMVIVSAALPLSVYALCAHFTGRGPTAIAAAIFSLIFWWLPYQAWAWGGYALLAGAVAALPVSRLMLDALDMRARGALALAAAALGGLLVVHPSQVFLALFVAAVVSVTYAVSRPAWRTSAAIFAGLIAASALGILIGEALWQPVREFVDKARAVSAISAVDPRYRLPVAAFFDLQMPRPAAFKAAIAALAATGAIAAIVHARLRPLLVLHVTFGVLVLMARSQTWVTALWYHQPERIWYAQATNQPMLTAAGVGAALYLASRLAAKWIDLARWQLAAWPLALWVVFMPLHERFESWADWRLHYAVYRNPALALTDRRLLTDFAWISANVPRGERLFNAPGDWGISLPFTGHRTIFWSGGIAVDPSTPWFDYFETLRRGDPDASQAAAELSALGVHYVYAGRLDPLLERSGRPSLDGAKLQGAAGLVSLYTSDTASVFRIPDIRPALLGLHDSERIRFHDFHRVEEAGRERWRWTNGSSRVSLTLPAPGVRECTVRILGPDPAAYELHHQGRVLPFAPEGYRLTGEVLSQGAIDLEIASRTFQAGDDPRRLGVRVKNVAFSCRS